LCASVCRFRRNLCLCVCVFYNRIVFVFELIPVHSISNSKRRASFAVFAYLIALKFV
jgi:hypothetical protein